MSLGSLYQTLINSLKEAVSAIRLADNNTSKRLLATDFILSRCLKWKHFPGHNQQRTVQVQGLNIHYRFNRGDVQSVREVILEDCYQLPFPFKPKSVLDLGSNIGLTSLWFWKHYGVEKVVAIEAEPANAEMVRLNFLSNAITGKVLSVAVGASSGWAFFSCQRASNIGMLVMDTTRSDIDGDRIEVPVVTIRSLLEQFEGHAVDLIKMDIEGAEHAIFGGEIEWLNRVGALIIEVHPEHGDVGMLIDSIKRAGFDFTQANRQKQDNLLAFVRPILGA